MVSAFLLLVPWVPYSALRAAQSEPAPAVSAPDERCAESFPCQPFAPPRASGGPDSGGPLSPLSERAVRATSRAWPWKPLETPGWKILMGDHFVLRGDVAIDDLRASGAYLEEFLRSIQGAIGGDAKDIMFSIRIFRDPRDFRRYAALAGAANAESYYDPRTQEVVICLDPARGRLGLQKTLAHEFAHEYMDRVFGCTSPLWFAEGMAEYFASFAVREGRVEPGAMDREAVRRVSLGAPEPLERFLAMTREDFYGHAFPLLYAQAWSLVHYLFSRGDGTIDLLLRGEKLEGVDEIEKGWRCHLEALEK